MVDEAVTIVDYITADTFDVNQGDFVVAYTQQDEGMLNAGGNYAAPVRKGDPLTLTGDLVLSKAGDGDEVIGWAKGNPVGKIPEGADGATITVATQTLQKVAVLINPSFGSMILEVTVVGSDTLADLGMYVELDANGKYVGIGSTYARGTGKLLKGASPSGSDYVVPVLF